MSSQVNSQSTPRQPRFQSPEEAQTFKGSPSEYNRKTLLTAAAERGCNCQPYQDWFTYDRWKAQGRQVQEGERAMRINVFLPADKDRPQRTWTSYVFCRCQTCDPDPNYRSQRAIAADLEAAAAAAAAHVEADDEW